MSQKSAQKQSSRSISSSLARPANLSRSRVSGKAWMTRVATWRFSPLSLLVELDPGLLVPDGLSLRTSPVCCRREAGAISPPSSGRWKNSGMGSPTEFWTLNSSEFPSAAAVSSLSDVLETGALPQRYFLSATACAGILRRAQKRGKELPSLLKLALLQAAQAGEPISSPAAA
jgi:hypothetical protein